MKLVSKGGISNRILLTVISIFSFCVTMGQQTPLNPVSYWVFVPYIYNPAIVGSKDFLSIGINAAFQGESNSQLISGNARITKTNSGYFSSPDITEFKNAGIGGSVYKDIDGFSKNIGISCSGSYQIPLNTRNLSFLSFGASVKAGYHTINNDSGQENSLKKTFYPNLDLGIYYYGTNFFAGVSSINIMGSPWGPDTLGLYIVPVSRQYFVTAGYKLLLSKSLNIVLEPSFLVSATDSTFRKIKDNLIPIIRLYLGDFCIGTSFRTGGKISFFSQFRYPRFYVGAFYELAKKTPYYKQTPIVEFTLGINILSDKSRFSNHSHW
ncbi:MAG TPA: PorP/SprF family type IX secretion system membrane protein [Bacteroidales bacterium]